MDSLVELKNRGYGKHYTGKELYRWKNTKCINIHIEVVARQKGKILCAWLKKRKTQDWKKLNLPVKTTVDHAGTKTGGGAPPKENQKGKKIIYVFF